MKNILINKQDVVACYYENGKSYIVMRNNKTFKCADETYSWMYHNNTSNFIEVTFDDDIEVSVIL